MLKQATALYKSIEIRWFDELISNLVLEHFHSLPPPPLRSRMPFVYDMYIGKIQLLAKEFS